MQENRRAGISSMDRRSFIAKTGLLVGATAIGGSVLGCAEFDISIPCLGPALVSTPVSGMTYVRASQSDARWIAISQTGAISTRAARRLMMGRA